MPQEFAGFGDSKWSHKLGEIETLGHRLCKHKVWMETRETGVMDCFSLRAH